MAVPYILAQSARLSRVGKLKKLLKGSSGAGVDGLTLSMLGGAGLLKMYEYFSSSPVFTEEELALLKQDETGVRAEEYETNTEKIQQDSQALDDATALGFSYATLQDMIDIKELDTTELTQEGLETIKDNVSVPEVTMLSLMQEQTKQSALQNKILSDKNVIEKAKVEALQDLGNTLSDVNILLTEFQAVYVKTMRSIVRDVSIMTTKSQKVDVKIQDAKEQYQKPQAEYFQAMMQGVFSGETDFWGDKEKLKDEDGNVIIPVVDKIKMLHEQSKAEQQEASFDWDEALAELENIMDFEGSEPNLFKHLLTLLVRDIDNKKIDEASEKNT